MAATIYAGMIGLLLGSFIGLVADRLPRGESILHPRSHCRTCDRQLKALDLIPVLSYLVRGGRCAACGAPIGRWAPLLELSTGAAMLLPVLWLGLWPGLPLAALVTFLYGLMVVALSYLRSARRTG